MCKPLGGITRLELVTGTALQLKTNSDSFRAWSTNNKHGTFARVEEEKEAYVAKDTESRVGGRCCQGARRICKMQQEDEVRLLKDT